MLDEYKNSAVWQNNPDEINLRSDLLVSKRVIELLGDITSKKILDIGCGNGKVSRLLSKKGAVVTGVDKIADQIKIAQNLNPELDIHYFIHDITRIDQLNLPNDFDIVISLMTFLYLDELEFIEAAQQIRKRLKPGGRFIYGNINPDRFQPNNEKIEKLEAELPTMNSDIFKTSFYKHPYSFVISTFMNAGFKIHTEIKPEETEDELKLYPALFPMNTRGQNPYVIIDMETI